MTDIEKCPKCGKRNGWIWHASKQILNGDGYSECSNCEAIFK